MKPKVPTLDSYSEKLELNNICYYFDDRHSLSKFPSMHYESSFLFALCIITTNNICYYFIYASNVKALLTELFACFHYCFTEIRDKRNIKKVHAN